MVSSSSGSRPDRESDVYKRQAYRTPAHNAKAGGAKFSQHLYGRAADIRVQDVSVELSLIHI